MESDAILKQALEEIEGVGSADSLQALRVKYLGRKSPLTALLRGLGKLPKEERAAAGASVNRAKEVVQAALDTRAQELQSAAESSIADTDWFDLSLPPPPRARGHRHPITIVEDDLDHLFRGMGYRVVEGPWAEDEWHNFDALNIPASHPARESWDTFWLSDGNLLRTHTSPVQIRAMKRFGAPLRAIFPGRVFRNEAVDATHEAVFNQLEGLVIDRDITPGHLFHSINAILSEILHEDVETRFRPGFFPFTEPSFECDIKREGKWMELCGMGMVHPHVLRAGGLDPDEWTGFAFGLGTDRLALMRWGIDDIRWFNSGDMRFLEQF
ncbi:MAG: phenylalanine--tRNA ligase subunit alpha [Planctomycetota bacterium]|nr:phenylalanine--tRNA ligase subunit alpha [Planctomycetota bacterium]